MTTEGPRSRAPGRPSRMSPELWNAVRDVSNAMEAGGHEKEGRLMRAWAVMVLGSPWDYEATVRVCPNCARVQP